MRFLRSILLGIAVVSLSSVWAETGKIDASKLVLDARKQVGVTISYDPEYRQLPYPNGDVPIETGVCTDVVIRSLRGQGLDLQKEVHEDMRKAFNRYPQSWGLSGPDANIDHRRVPNLMAYFARQGLQLPISTEKSDYRPGDIVAWDLGRGITHIGIVSDVLTENKCPLVIHNIGSGAREEDVLFSFKQIEHYRLNTN